MSEPAEGGEEHPSKRRRLSTPHEGTSSSSIPHSLINQEQQQGPPDDPKVADGLPRKDSKENALDIETDKELNVGISVFVNRHTHGFAGILKQRYTDFLVNEVLPNGKVLHLENVNVPAFGKASGEAAQTETSTESVQIQPGEARSQESVKADEETIGTGLNGDVVAQPAGDGEHHSTKPEDRTALNAIFGDTTSDAIIKLHEQVLKYPGRKPRDFKLVTSSQISDKDERKAAHQVIRTVFSSRLETSTNDDGAIVVTVAPLPVKGARWSKPKDGAQRGKGKLGWEELGGEHLHFTLYKENKDTMEVIYFLASQLKMNIKGFQFAGTKDRRAVTVQRVSIYRVHAERLAQIGRNLRNAKVGDYEYRHTALELGELNGNAFVITLRDCHFAGEEGLIREQRLVLANKVLDEATRAFSANGFLNYYGLQRFGAFSTTTDSIGLKLLQGNFSGAVDDILSYSSTALAAAQNGDTESKISSDDKARAEALHNWQTTKNANTAIEKLPRKFSAEMNIIRHLGYWDKRTGRLTKENDYQGALNTISRNLRLMYVHAYQSLVWNVVASRRWERFGNNVVEGDMVVVKEGQKTAQDTTQDVDEQGEPIVQPAAGDSALDGADKFTRACPLTAAEAASGKHSIFDIVLPLPGYDVEYPSNEVGAFYKEFMASPRGGGLDPTDMRRKWKDISLSGGYRKLMARPEHGVRFTTHEYVRDEEQFVATDLDRLDKGEKRSEGQMDMPDGGIESAEVQMKIAVVVNMQLGAGQYATVALRELMKEGGLKTFKPDFGGGR